MAEVDTGIKIESPDNQLQEDLTNTKEVLSG